VQANGQPLPRWLEHVAPNLLVGRPPADATSMALRVKILYSDGTFEMKDVRVDTTSGHISEIRQKGASLVVPFQSQFSTLGTLTDDDIGLLAIALSHDGDARGF
jgi:hypothetical protein